jgi:GNAT superfamily N-acetyltransferase
MTSGPFCDSADLILGDGRPRARLRPLAPEACPRLAETLVAMPPWSVLGHTAEVMLRYLSAEDGARRYLIEIGGAEAGVASVRHPWLKGPYLELLALLPGFQGNGVGAAFLHWYEQQATACGARNLWVCASRINARALQFYGRHGFQEVAVLPDLVADGFDEILLRKSPPGPATGGD